MNGATAGRVVRTLRHLRPSQALAQVRHLLTPGPPGRIDVHSDPVLTVRAIPVPFLPPSAQAYACSDANADARTPGSPVGSQVTVHLLERDVVFQDGIDWDYDREGPLFAYNLHHFDYARCEALSPESRLAWMLDWVEHHRAGIGWAPHPMSHRVLAWGKLMLTPGALGDDESALAVLRRSLASQIETLSHNLEIRLQANHLFTNLVAVVFGGLLFDCPESGGWLGRADALQAELRDQIHPDGSHEERSPMYHALLLEQVLDLLNLARALPDRAPTGLVDALEDVAARMCGALEVWTHPDGNIALFSDAAMGIAQTPSALDEYASAQRIAVTRPEQSDYLNRGGFVRLLDETWHLIASVAGPGPDHMPGHAHCDALAFELSVLGRRVVTDTGVYEYVPGPDRETARSTRSHATVEVDGRDQAEIWAVHRVGGRPRVRVIDFEPGQAAEASCQSWSTPDVVHRRRFELRDGGLDVQDHIEASRSVPLRFSLPLAPGLRGRLVGEGDGAQTLRVVLDGDRVLDVELPGPGTVTWRLELSDYFESFGRRQQRWCLVGDSHSFRAGTWRFRLLGGSVG